MPGRTLLCPGSADGLPGDFGTEAALQALVFRPLSPDCQPDDKHTLVYYAILPLEQKESAAAVPVPGQMGGETDHGKG